MKTIASASSTNSPHRIGYARVSSVGQNLNSQVDALQRTGCGKIFSEKMTGSRMDRPVWKQVLEYARSGDTLLVTELSRMTRSLLDLLETVKMMEQRQINIVSLRENIDTLTAAGCCFLSMMGAIHQMERKLRAERASAGRSAAKALGRTGGRPKTDPAKLENARILYENSDKIVARKVPKFTAGKALPPLILDTDTHRSGDTGKQRSSEKCALPKRRMKRHASWAMKQHDVSKLSILYLSLKNI